jgi:CheY-like chemotaxis protein
LFNAILASIDQKVHVGRRHPRDGWPEPPRSLRILLAEDNPINQAFAVSLLNERGHSVEVADNGLRAIEAWEREDFDVVLMDVQMPEMDGPQATAVIGEKEKATDAHTQIIALTAYAMKGDRERCLRAGMDGYVTKPIQVEQLLSLIEGWDRLPGREESERDEGVFDMEALMKRARGRKEVMLRIVAMMLEQSPRLTKEIKEAIASGDCRAVEQAAHMLKGSAGHFGASPVSDAALKLERMGREGDLRGAKEARRGSRLAQPVAYGSDGRERGCG